RFPGPGHRRSRRYSRPETGDRAAFVATDISARARSGFRGDYVAALYANRLPLRSKNSYRRSKPPSVPRTSARPTELPSDPPTDLPRSATTPPMTLLVTDRVTSRAITWPVDSLPRLTLVPKIVPTIEPICPRTPPPAPPSAPSAGAAVPATRFCSIS